MSGKPLSLYSSEPAPGLLKGYSPTPHQLEVEAVLPHHERGLPGLGEFVLVELSETEALVGRASRYSAAGQLVSERGDAYLVDLVKNAEEVPAAVMGQMLRYSLKLQLLGNLRLNDRSGKFEFTVGDRTFATLGSRIRLPSAAALRFLCNIGIEDDPTAALLGHLAYGREVYPEVPVKFSVARLKGRRSFVFARAGYGKSNLIKHLVSQIYTSPPDVGLLVFDPEGEYALPDAHGRPGLLNVPELAPRISLYTNRKLEAPFAETPRGSVYVDFGDFPPQDIVAAFVPAEKQETVFANLIRSLDWNVWKKLVALLAADGFKADDKKISQLLSFNAREKDVSIAAVKNNLVPPIRRLHQPGATLGKNILEELRRNRVVIVDVSLLGGDDSLAITSMLMRRVFHNNVRHMTDLSGSTVRCLAVLEEAQTVLGDRMLDDRNIFVRWIKEGRKYDLGCVLVTQQPSSISSQIISQGDNFFVLHLLNEGDLQTLKRHNAYFTDEILSVIRGEPIPGNCYFWSAPNQPFVLPARVRNFEETCRRDQKAESHPRESGIEGKQLAAAVAKVVKEILCSGDRVWLYRVSTLFGKKEAGWIAFSRDYLLNSVAQRLTRQESSKWKQDQLAAEIESTLKRHRARAGFANLEGSSRPVWAIPQRELKLTGGKQLQPHPVAVTEFI